MSTSQTDLSPIEYLQKLKDEMQIPHSDVNSNVDDIDELNLNFDDLNAPPLCEREPQGRCCDRE